jgi:hypothetical protein
MDYKAFSKKIAKEVKKMDQLELYEFTMDLLRYIPEKRRDMVLESVAYKDCEDSSNNTPVQNEYERIMNLCEAISTGEKLLKGLFREGYDYGYDDNIEYDDIDGIEEDLKDALEVANWMLLKKEYKYADDIYDAVETLVICIEYDDEYDNDYYEQSDFTFEEFIAEINLNIDTHKVAMETLYATYMNTDKSNRVQKMYGHYGWNSQSLVKLDELVTIGYEELPDLNEFLGDWIELLKGESGNNVAELLEDAFIYLEGKESLEKYAKELPDKFPGFYVHWFEELFRNGDYVKIANEAEKAFKVIENVSGERYLIANMTYMASKELNNGEMMYRSSKVMFEAKPCVKTFLRLKTLPLAEPLCKGIIVPPIETVNLNVDEKEQMIMMVFNGQWHKVWMKLSKNKEALGWSHDPKGLVVPLFLIMLVDGNMITPLMERLLARIKSRLDYSMQMDDMDFMEYYKLWRNSVKITKKDHKGLYHWCENEVTKRVREIVSNGYRKAYFKAAEASLLLSEVGFYTGETQSKDEIALKHQSEFPRHSAFKREYDNLY